MSSIVKKGTSKQSNLQSKIQCVDKYEDLLAEITLNDDSWKCIVIMLVETDNQPAEMAEYLAALDDVLVNGHRKSIWTLSRSRLISAIQRRASIYTGSAVKQTPLMERLRQSLRVALPDDGSEISRCLEAGLIKWKLYEERLERLARAAADAEIKAEHEREIAAMQMPPGAKVARPGSARKPNSKLRKRGEEWKDITFIDDAPYNGPNLYVLLTGFGNPLLPHELVKIGVPLKCIFKLDHLRNCRRSKATLAHRSQMKSVFSLSDYFSASTVTSASSSSLRSSSMMMSSPSTSNNFWNLFESDDLCDLIIRSYCPLWCPNIDLDKVYNAVSYAMYDVYDTIQSHVRYLKNMRLVSVDDPDPEPVSYHEYIEVMCSAPEECDSTTIVLEAILAQIEEEFRDEGEESYLGTSTEDNDPYVCLSDKLRELNVEHEIQLDPTWVQPCDNPCNCSLDPELVMHGDKLSLDVCRAVDGAGDWRITKYGPRRDVIWTGGSFGKGILAAPWINEAWNEADDNDLEIINMLMPGILKCCSAQGVDPYRAMHLFNLLDFRRIIDILQKRDGSASHQSAMRLNSLQTFASRTVLKDLKSAYKSRTNMSYATRAKESTYSFVTSSDVVINTITSSSYADEESDCSSARRGIGEARRSHLLRYFENCSTIFGLLNARESLGLGEYSCPLKLEDYHCAEMLSAKGFLQMLLDECEHEYQIKIVRWFGPTDSVLVMYYDEDHKPGETIESSSCLALRTPVCLRDFCEYVVREERDWLKGQANLGGRSVERCRRRLEAVPQEEEDQDQVIWEDACFVLPGSIKADSQYQQRAEDNFNQGSPNGDQGSVDSIRDSLNCVSVLNQATLVSPLSVPYLDYDQPLPRFIGYDLGENRRVHVTNLDGYYDGHEGTRVKYASECWMMGDPKNKTRTVMVQIYPNNTVNSNKRWSLRYHEIDSKQGTWQLRTKCGIIIAFERLRRLKKKSRPNEMLYDLQMSWPSGLIVKPLEYSKREYPFCVMQYYTTKGPGCQIIENESHRKYLVNGDVVKFMKDSTVIVYRPNGRVITVPDFFKGDAKSNSSSLIFSNFSNFSWGNTPVSSMTGTPRSSMSSADVVTTHTAPLGHPVPVFQVLELDGSSYEVVDGKEIRALDRSRVIVCEEYDPGEKFVRRDDGTDALFTAEAELIVDFPDGTRVVSSCEIEEEPVWCEWSDEEREVYKIEEDAEQGFVSVTLYWRAEHPNYATVTRRESRCLVSMGADKPSFELGPRGFGTINCDQSSQIQLLLGKVVLNQFECHKCKIAKSQGVFYPRTRINFFEFADAKSRLKLRRMNPYDTGSFATTTSDSLELEQCCMHVSMPPPRINARLFAVQKDNTVYEYHPKEVLEELETQPGKEPSIVTVEDRAIFLLPIRKTLGALSDWNLDYTIQEARPTLQFNPEEDYPITLDRSERPPQFLETRLLSYACKPGQNSPMSMQRALMEYWQQVAVHKVEEVTLDGSPADLMIPQDDKFYNFMKSISHQRISNIDLDLYEEGRKYFEKIRKSRQPDDVSEKIDPGNV